MSAFLGPIHHWLFHKIQIQHELVEEVIKLGEKLSPDLREEMELKYGRFPEGPLEEIIDVTNIHGWLQRYVSQVEYKLADSVTALIIKEPEIFHNIKEVFYNKGKELSLAVTTDNAKEAYKFISDSLLDGMPCDHANTVLEEKEENVVWIRNICVHTSYWEEAGGNIENYYSLREELIRGILADRNLKYEKQDEITNRVGRKE